MLPIPKIPWNGNLFVSVGIALLGTFFLAQIPEPPVIEIHSPDPGQALQGSFPVRATVQVPGFATGVLSFRYTEDPTGSWFELTRFQEEFEDTELVLWDTTTLTDGNYDLQLIVDREEEEPLILTISGLRVRNYSLIETNTPAPTSTQSPNMEATPNPTGTPQPTSVPATPTDLPPNSAEIRETDIGASLLSGIITSLAAFGAVGLLLLLRALSRR
jgi:hypothetical protein